MTTPREQLIEQFDQLDEAKQQILLSYARKLSQTPIIQGEPGTSIAQATDFLDLQALDEIEAAIGDACEEIDWREWE